MTDTERVIDNVLQIVGQETEQFLLDILLEGLRRKHPWTPPGIGYSRDQVALVIARGILWSKAWRVEILQNILLDRLARKTLEEIDPEEDYTGFGEEEPATFQCWLALDEREQAYNQVQRLEAKCLHRDKS